METLDGIVEDIIYRNEENGYCVLSVSTEAGEKTAVGCVFNIAVGEEIHARGHTSTHLVYGDQFNIQDYHCAIPQELKAMERYLGSGAVKGIGPAMAAKIVEMFGEDTFRVLEEEPELLERVKGISLKKAQAIAAIFYEQRTMRQAMIFLQEYGISVNYALKIYQEYREKTYEVVKNNPYQLAEDVHGIGFKMADSIAEQVGIPKESVHRTMAGMLYLLHQATLDGHVYLSREELFRSAGALLQADGTQLESALIRLKLQNRIVSVSLPGVEEAVYLGVYHAMEQGAALKLHEVAHGVGTGRGDSQEWITRFEKEEGIEFDPSQKEAIVKAQTCGLLVITGGPGTGKTTTINAIIRLFEEQDLTVALAAPTGRAAKRMTEATGREAKTIHRLLEITFGKDELHQRFERNEEYPLECDVLIVDESSMMDLTIFHHLLKAIPVGTRLILVGDKDQLPSVGAGNVLGDILACRDIFDVVVLQKIFRQAMESDIIMNAHKINHGEVPDLRRNSKDFFFIRRSNPTRILEELTSLVKTRLPKFAGCDSLEGIQVLTPMRKGILGVENLNVVLQAALNPPAKDKREKECRGIRFREGDKVMQVKNNYNLSWTVMNDLNFKIDEGTGVFNGDIGTILSINTYTETLKIRFDDQRQVNYEFSGLDELELAYATTIHKAQGSEYKVVVIPLFKGPPMLLSRNLLYTAITRARQYVVIVGTEETVVEMIANNREVRRNTSLSEQIRRLAIGERGA
ncbi:SF1B family DNA helicase RecD2 [Anaerotalea alkaliphila]|uniref:ATP-dependent RecD2 DNA helicase n=1 Tax=Anaerotalea alkaliphila TaxID=2662126 RepID=A0A7X5HX84_9FIRM|nr:ATP-dependent RecD-like DNA helicase [Anaerotalea alkaliphila]NDL68286.1 ATP-dependent RecD-like DNA helicase [Anaerotalea alkaliphila]